MNRLMMTSLLTMVLWGSGHVATASEAPTIDLGHAKINQADDASLQRGAKVFMNYCSGCHSLEFVRYERLAQDLHITDEKGAVYTNLMKKNLMFTGDKIGETIKIAMRGSDSALWFGVTPPDLSLIARARGTDWLYGYFKGFYRDDSRPWGVNNVVFPEVSMPHMLLSLQGLQEPIYETHVMHVGTETQVTKQLIGLKPGTKGSLTPEQYDQVVNDLVNFLAYAADPVKLERERIGIWVILFLVIFLAFAYLLKREYWKDIHD